MPAALQDAMIQCLSPRPSDKDLDAETANFEPVRSVMIVHANVSESEEPKP